MEVEGISTLSDPVLTIIDDERDEEKEVWMCREIYDF